MNEFCDSQQLVGFTIGLRKTRVMCVVVVKIEQHLVHKSLQPPRKITVLCESTKRNDDRTRRDVLMGRR